MKFLSLFKFLALVAALSLTLAACGARSSDEERVREVVQKIEHAAEARDASDVLAFIANDYADRGGYDKPQIQGFLRGYFLLNPKVELVVGIDDLEFPVPGMARATVNVTSLLAADRATFKVELREQSDEWQVVRADRVRE